MSELYNPERSTGTPSLRSRITHFLGKAAAEVRQGKNVASEVRRQTTRERYWSLRNEGRRAEAEMVLLDESASSAERIFDGAPQIILPEGAMRPTFDARRWDMSSLSDVALSVAVGDRLYGFFSIDDLQADDQARVVDISKLSDMERRSAIREVLSLAATKDSPSNGE